MKRAATGGAVPTITDIARRVGVSHTAVSLALRGAPGVSEVLRERIHAMAVELRYHPQIAAKLLRARHTGQIGLIVQRASDVARSSGFALPMMMQFVQVCEDEQVGYHLEFFEDDEARPFAPPPQVVGGLVDGTITVGFISARLRAWLEAERVPWVSTEEPAPTCVMSASDRGVHAAVQHLAALGHRAIAFAGGPRRYSAHRLSHAGFVRAAGEFRLTRRAAWVTELELEDATGVHAVARAWARPLLAAVRRPTAVLVTDHRVGKVLLHEALLRGLRVPEDLSVISYGTVTDAEQGSPILTTIENDFHQVVATAVRQLRRRLAGRRIAGGTAWVLPRLVPGETVAPPTSKPRK